MSSPSADPRRADVIIIGGGAAGLMAAAVAARRGRRVVVMEHNDRVGKKILISGGGRCNFTNLNAQAANYISGQPDFCKSALARYRPEAFVRLVESYGIAYHEKKLGQQFCDTSSREIVDLLLQECAEAGAEILTSCRVESIRHVDSHYELTTFRGAWECAAVIIATGGLSFPKLGASDFGYRIARQFGLTVTDLRPGLVPLTFTHRDAIWAELSGVSLDVRASFGSRHFDEALLWTHRGVSGPAILQISSYWKEGDELEFDFAPSPEAQKYLQTQRRGGENLEQTLGRLWPQRFAREWRRQSGLWGDRPLAQLSAAEWQQIDDAVHRWRMPFAGTEGYPKAEVTVGGVATSELSSKTMEARNVPGLYFIGEVVDVTGWLGGYNFQWAWASGNAAGLAA